MLIETLPPLHQFHHQMPLPVLIKFLYIAVKLFLKYMGGGIGYKSLFKDCNVGGGGKIVDDFKFNVFLISYFI